uniref:Uncharacterized protein n=1 Tax=Pipistrellus kuhlii TaxID=59472 RepID=A0A7J7XVS3_PIPKU|nr:hypothetical protein mPipKuh1_010432 [Pipistrellus kuhlii]
MSIIGHCHQFSTDRSPVWGREEPVSSANSSAMVHAAGEQHGPADSTQCGSSLMTQHGCGTALPGASLGHNSLVPSTRLLQLGCRPGTCLLTSPRQHEGYSSSQGTVSGGNEKFTVLLSWPRKKLTRLIHLPLSITIMACCSLGSYKGISWITWESKGGWG